MIKHIIFDWDDTITLGSYDGYIACYVDAVKRTSPEIDRAHVIEMVNQYWGAKAEDVILKIVSGDQTKVEETYKFYLQNVFSELFLAKLELVPGVCGVLTKLSEQYKLTVATGMNGTLLKEHVFPKFQIPDVFVKTMSVNELSKSEQAKPSPFMIHELMNATQTSIDETVMVGDSKTDIIMANAAGIKSIAVLTGSLTKEKARELGAQIVIDDVSKLPEALSKV